MSCMKKRLTGCFAAGAVALGLLLALPGGASAECTQPTPPGPPTSGQDLSENPPGEVAVQTCSPFPLREIGRRH
jgi:hypothetical protein